MPLKYENDFIVSGRPGDAITPNFKVKEFSEGGAIFAHRELIGALQELRDSHGASISIQGLAPRGARGKNARGCFAFVRADDMGALETKARALVAQTFLASAERAGSDLYVEIPDPQRLPPLQAAGAFERAIRVTAAYETSGDPFQSASGNFDGAGLSFGPLQVNFGTGTLQELFVRFRGADLPALAACFSRPEHWDEWQGVLRLPRARQIAWADARSTGAGKSRVAEPWNGYLQAVGRNEVFRREMLRYAYDVYGRKLIVALSWLKGLWPGKIDSFPCLSALYDLCVQQGSLDKAHNAIRARVAAERPDTQTKLVHIAVEERGRTASAEWRADCISRRLGILYREPTTVNESGKRATRENLRVYLVRDVAVKGAEQYLT
jgi:hypothetical protein